MVTDNVTVTLTDPFYKYLDPDLSNNLIIVIFIIPYSLGKIHLSRIRLYPSSFCRTM